LAKGGKPTSPELPQRIAAKHAAILATSAPDPMSEQQQTLFDRIVAQCPDAMLLRNLSLDSRQALTSSEGWRLESWIEVVKQSLPYSPVIALAVGPTP
jgi:hypothetical protein